MGWTRYLVSHRENCAFANLGRAEIQQRVISDEWCSLCRVRTHTEPQRGIHASVWTERVAGNATNKINLLYFLGVFLFLFLFLFVCWWSGDQECPSLITYIDIYWFVLVKIIKITSKGSRSSQCSTTGVTKAVVCIILSVGWCI